MTDTRLIIRPLKREDEPEWRRLWTAYLEYYETTLPEEIFQTTFERLLSGKDHEFQGFLALWEGKPVGLTHYLFHRSCWQIDHVCYLQDLFVDPQVRGRSFGRALIEAVYDAADKAGNPGVYWMTQDFNQAGRRLYDRVAELTPFIIYEREV